MKKVISFVAFLFYGLILIAQENNPYKQRGYDYVTSINLIADDFANGLVRDFSEEALVNYSTRMPLQNQVSMNMVSTIFGTLKTPKFDAMSYINNSSMPDVAKDVLKNILQYSRDYTGNDLRLRLTALTNDVVNSGLSQSHKEFTLSLIAIANNSEGFSGTLRSRQNQGGCILSGPNGTGEVTGDACILAGVLVGAWIGFEICGPLCMLGGAIIGGVIGSLS